MGRYDALFQPMKIGSLEVKNRIVLGAMGIGWIVYCRRR